MAFHKSNLGSFGADLPCDLAGYVPEADDRAEQFDVDLVGDDQREWWYEDGGFEEWRDEAVKATAKAEAALAEWQEQNA